MNFQVVQNCDELFERQEFSAAPDPGWPDCFNSGVFVFVPSIDTYEVNILYVRIWMYIMLVISAGGNHDTLSSYLNVCNVSDIW